MEVHVYSNVVRQRYNDNTRRPKSKENQLGILKTYAFCQKIQQRASGPEETTSGVTYLLIRMHPKNGRIFPLKVAATLLRGSRKGATGA